MTTNLNEPTPEFLRFLEWQVTTSVRRQSRFDEPPPPRYRKFLGAAALVVVSLLVGAGGVAASGRAQDNKEKNALLMQLRGDVELANMLVKLSETNRALAKQRTDAGVAGPADLQNAETAHRVAVLGLERTQINVAEVTASSRPVQDDITSPLVNGTDYVSQRLEVDQQIATLTAASADQAVANLQKRVEVGLAMPLDMLDAEAKRTQAVSDLQTLRDKLDLRKKFLSGAIKPEAVTRERMLFTTRNQVRAAEMAFEAASKRFALVQKLTQIGTARDVDMLKAQVDMLTKQQDLAALKTRLQTLERGGE